MISSDVHLCMGMWSAAKRANPAQVPLDTPVLACVDNITCTGTGLLISAHLRLSASASGTAGLRASMTRVSTLLPRECAVWPRWRAFPLFCHVSVPCGPGGARFRSTAMWVCHAVPLVRMLTHLAHNLCHACCHRSVACKSTVSVCHVALFSRVRGSECAGTPAPAHPTAQHQTAWSPFFACNWILSSPFAVCLVLLSRWACCQWSGLCRLWQPACGGLLPLPGHTSAVARWKCDVCEHASAYKMHSCPWHRERRAPVPCALVYYLQVRLCMPVCACLCAPCPHRLQRVGATSCW